MDEGFPDTGTLTAPAIWPSIDDVRPDEEGGPAARRGFNYQDEIAASFLIEMLETPALLKVHCETHDDIVLVHQIGTTSERSAEFVQVKASEQDKLWSIADLCLQRKSRAGTSIFEISLGRDKHEELSLFRMLAPRPVVAELKPLTYPYDSPSRTADAAAMAALHSTLVDRFPGFASAKGNEASYWLKNCRWDQRHSEDIVRQNNLIGLIRLSQREGRPLLIEPAEELLSELRVKAKAAGDARWDPDPNRKIITRAALLAWWERRMSELENGAAT